MIRGKFYTGTVATTSNLVVNIGANEEITRITIIQTAADFALVLMEHNNESANVVIMTETGGFDYLLGTTYVKVINDMADFKIFNDHASNILTYFVWTKEHLT